MQQNTHLLSRTVNENDTSCKKPPNTVNKVKLNYFILFLFHLEGEVFSCF